MKAPDGWLVMTTCPMRAILPDSCRESQWGTVQWVILFNTPSMPILTLITSFQIKFKVFK